MRTVVKIGTLLVLVGVCIGCDGDGPSFGRFRANVTGDVALDITGKARVLRWFDSFGGPYELSLRLESDALSIFVDTYDSTLFHQHGTYSIDFDEGFAVYALSPNDLGRYRATSGSVEIGYSDGRAVIGAFEFAAVFEPLDSSAVKNIDVVGEFNGRYEIAYYPF